MKKVITYLVFLAAPLCQGQESGAAVTGRLLNPNGTPANAGWITITRTDQETSQAPFSADQVVRPDGTFAFTKLEPGTYRLCGNAPNGIALSPCQWGERPTSVVVGPGQTVEGIELALLLPAALVIRINDPAGAVAAQKGKRAPGSELLIGVLADGFTFHPALAVNADPRGRNYRVMVPVGKSVQLMMDSNLFDIADSTGKAMPPSGARTPVTIPLDGSPSIVTFNVRGVRAGGGAK